MGQNINGINKEEARALIRAWQRKFLEHYYGNDHGNMEAAAKRCHLNMETIELWRKHDKKFKGAVDRNDKVAVNELYNGISPQMPQDAAIALNLTQRVFVDEVYLPPGTPPAAPPLPNAPPKLPSAPPSEPPARQRPPEVNAPPAPKKPLAFTPKPAVRPTAPKPVRPMPGQPVPPSKPMGSAAVTTSSVPPARKPPARASTPQPMKLVVIAPPPPKPTPGMPIKSPEIPDIPGPPEHHGPRAHILRNPPIRRRITWNEVSAKTRQWSEGADISDVQKKISGGLCGIQRGLKRRRRCKKVS